MNCQDIKNKIPDLLEGRLSQSEAREVRRHVAQCRICENEVKAYEDVWELLGSWGDAVPEPGYTSRFWTRMALPTSWTQRFLQGFRPVRRRLVPALTAFCVLVIVGSVTWRTFLRSPSARTAEAPLSAEEIEFMENIELVEQYDLVTDMDLIEDWQMIEDWNGQGA